MIIVITESEFIKIKHTLEKISDITEMSSTMTESEIRAIVLAKANKIQNAEYLLVIYYPPAGLWDYAAGIQHADGFVYRKKDDTRRESISSIAQMDYLHDKLKELQRI